MIPVRGYKNCSVGVLGLSRTGIATAQALLLGGASPLSWDDNSSKREAASKAGLEIFDLNEEVNLDKIVEHLLQNAPNGALGGPLLKLKSGSAPFRGHTRIQ